MGRALQTSWLAAMAAALFSLATDVSAGSPRPAVGEAYEITRSYETSQKGGDGLSSGGSRGRDTILERIVEVREGGIEVVYDLPQNATAEERARTWQFPVRVFRPSSGPMRVLNQAELEVRLETWLKAAGLTRAACGAWIFTWNAFRIECDPQSVVKTIEAFDLRSAEVRDGGSYHEAGARGLGRLARKAVRPDGATFAAVMDVDPDAVRQERAEADVAVGEIVKEPVTLEAALRERAREDVSGTITVTFDTDRTGNPWRRTKVTRLEITSPDGRSESQTVTETLQRRLVSGASGHR